MSPKFLLSLLVVAIFATAINADWDEQQDDFSYDDTDDALDELTKGRQIDGPSKAKLRDLISKGKFSKHDIEKIKKIPGVVSKLKVLLPKTKLTAEKIRELLRHLKIKKAADDINDDDVTDNEVKLRHHVVEMGAADDINDDDVTYDEDLPYQGRRGKLDGLKFVAKPVLEYGSKGLKYAAEGFKSVGNAAYEAGKYAVEGAKSAVNAAYELGKDGIKYITKKVSGSKDVNIPDLPDFGESENKEQDDISYDEADDHIQRRSEFVPRYQTRPIEPVMSYPTLYQPQYPIYPYVIVRGNPQFATEAAKKRVYSLYG